MKIETSYQVHSTLLEKLTVGSPFIYKGDFLLLMDKKIGEDYYCVSLNNGKLFVLQTDTMVTALPNAIFYPYGTLPPR